MPLATCPAPAGNSPYRNVGAPVCVIRAALGICVCAAVSAPALAETGCVVMLCLAAPSWRDIPQCVGPVRQVLRDLTRGKPFPICGMSGFGNTAGHEWAYAPTFCPPQYSRVHDSEGGPFHTCDYAGAVTVWVNGVLFTRTWWSMDGDAVTDFSPAARAQLGTWNTRFDDDYAAWLASLPPSMPPIVSSH